MLFLLIGRYVAPEVFNQEEYDTKVDVFSFALILQEVTNFSVLSLCGTIHCTNNIFSYIEYLLFINIIEHIFVPYKTENKILRHL